MKSIGSLPARTSVVSRYPSPSSSSSELLPIPSPSVSNHSEGSFGNTSNVSLTPSPSVSTIDPPPMGPEPGVDIELHTPKSSSVIVMFTVVDAVFPELSVTE